MLLTSIPHTELTSRWVKALGQLAQPRIYHLWFLTRGFAVCTLPKLTGWEYPGGHTPALPGAL